MDRAATLRVEERCGLIALIAAWNRKREQAASSAAVDPYRATDTAFSLTEMERTEARLWRSLAAVIAVGVMAGCVVSAMAAAQGQEAAGEVAEVLAGSLSRIVAYVSVIIGAVVGLHLRVWELAKEAKKDAASEATTLGRLGYYETLAFVAAFLMTVTATILTIACIIDHSHGAHVVILNLTVFACACVCADTSAMPVDRQRARASAASQARLKRLVVARERWPSGVSPWRRGFCVLLRGVVVAAVWWLVAAAVGAALGSRAQLVPAAVSASLVGTVATLQLVNQWLVVTAMTDLVCRRLGQSIVIWIVALGGYLVALGYVLVALTLTDWRVSVAIGGAYVSLLALAVVDLWVRGRRAIGWVSIGSPMAWGVASGIDRAITWERRDSKTPSASGLRRWYDRFTGVESGTEPSIV